MRCGVVKKALLNIYVLLGFFASETRDPTHIDRTCMTGIQRQDQAIWFLLLLGCTSNSHYGQLDFHRQLLSHVSCSTQRESSAGSLGSIVFELCPAHIKRFTLCGWLLSTSSTERALVRNRKTPCTCGVVLIWKAILGSTRTMRSLQIASNDRWFASSLGHALCILAISEEPRYNEHTGRVSRQDAPACLVVFVWSMIQVQ